MTEGGLYFAYGSNLRTSRMRARIPSAESVGIARLVGFGLRIGKRGRDGSAKANLAPAVDEHVWGVVYRIETTAWPDLDRFEGGYERRGVTVELAGSRANATTYQSELRIEDALAYDWYLAHVREGAREHGLPAEWCAWLESIRGRPGAEPR